MTQCCGVRGRKECVVEEKRKRWDLTRPGHMSKSESSGKASRWGELCEQFLETEMDKTFWGTANK